MSSLSNISDNVPTQIPITEQTSLSGTDTSLNNVPCITLERPQKGLDGQKSDDNEARAESKGAQGGEVSLLFLKTVHCC